MPAPISVDVPRSTEIKRLPWMRRIHVYSPKLARMLALFSTESLKAWALVESCPFIETFCEHPGYVQIDGRRRLVHLDDDSNVGLHARLVPPRACLIRRSSLRARGVGSWPFLST